MTWRLPDSMAHGIANTVYCLRLLDFYGEPILPARCAYFPLLLGEFTSQGHLTMMWTLDCFKFSDEKWKGLVERLPPSPPLEGISMSRACRR